MYSVGEYPLNKPIPGKEAECQVASIQMKTIDGKKFGGDLEVLFHGLSPETLKWNAKYNGLDRWSIEVSEADKEILPGVVSLLTEWLNDQKKDDSKKPEIPIFGVLGGVGPPNPAAKPTLPKPTLPKPTEIDPPPPKNRQKQERLEPEPEQKPEPKPKSEKKIPPMANHLTLPRLRKSRYPSPSLNPNPSPKVRVPVSAPNLSGSRNGRKNPTANGSHPSPDSGYSPECPLGLISELFFYITFRTRKPSRGKSFDNLAHVYGLSPEEALKVIGGIQVEIETDGQHLVPLLEMAMKGLSVDLNA